MCVTERWATSPTTNATIVKRIAPRHPVDGYAGAPMNASGSASIRPVHTVISTSARRPSMSATQTTASMASEE